MNVTGKILRTASIIRFVHIQFKISIKTYQVFNKRSRNQNYKDYIQQKSAKVTKIKKNPWAFVHKGSDILNIWTLNDGY